MTRNAQPPPAITSRPVLTTQAELSLRERNITLAEVDEAVMHGHTTPIADSNRAVISHKDLRLAVKRSGADWYLTTAMRAGDLRS